MMGIYEITNLHDGKATSYVGSSVDIKRRWADHIRFLRSKQHVNPHLQSAFDRDGEGAFSFCVLEEVASKQDLLGREQWWLDYMFEMTDDLYNIAQDAAAPTRGRTIIITERRRQACSKAARARLLTTEGVRQMKAIGILNIKPYPAFIHDETGAIITAGKNLAGMCQRRGLSYKCMWKVVHRQCRSHQGWMLLDTDTRPPSRKGSQYPAFRHRETGGIIPAGRNLTKLCKERGLDPQNMWSVVWGRYNHHQGWELIVPKEVT